MKCPKCGEENLETSNYCKKCATSLKEVLSQSKQSPPPKKEDKIFSIALSIIGVVIFIIIIITLSYGRNKPIPVSASTASPSPTIESTPAPTEDIALIESMIRVYDVSVSAPNSADGVDCSVDFSNISEKTIKYITFTVEPYNAVGDMVEDEIRNSSITNLKLTGPIESTGSSHKARTWECAWYNSTIASAKLTGIYIEYMDGSNLDVSSDAISQLNY